MKNFIKFLNHEVVYKITTQESFSQFLKLCNMQHKITIANLYAWEACDYPNQLPDDLYAINTYNTHAYLQFSENQINLPVAEFECPYDIDELKDFFMGSFAYHCPTSEAFDHLYILCQINNTATNMNLWHGDEWGIYTERTTLYYDFSRKFSTDRVLACVPEDWNAKIKDFPFVKLTNNEVTTVAEVNTDNTVELTEPIEHTLKEMIGLNSLVKFRNGEIRFVTEYQDTLAFNYKGESSCSLDCYNDDLTFKSQNINSSRDIIAITSFAHQTGAMYQSCLHHATDNLNNIKWSIFCNKAKMTLPEIETKLGYNVELVNN
jgi:hypothetical protein